MNTKTRQQLKLLISAGLIVLSLRMIIAGWLNYRATTDEALVFYDLYYTFFSGHLYNPSYFSGMSFQIITTIIRTISGLSLISLDSVSPFISGLAFIFISLNLYLILRSSYSTSTVWVAILPLLGLFVFSGYINRLAESTHKVYTFALLFATYLSIYNYLDNNNKIFLFIAFLFITSTATYNYIWGLVYGSIFVIAILILHREPIIHPGTLIFMIAPLIILFYLPGVQPHTAYFNEFIAAFVSQSTESASVLTQAGQRTASWPEISFFGHQFTIWWIYISGILFVGAISVVSGISFIYDIYHKVELTPIRIIYVSTVIILGGLAASLLIIGELATLKRIAPLIGVISIVYLVYSTKRYALPVDRSKVVICIAIGLLITAPLAVPRMTLDESTGSPYDFYAETNQVEHIIWVEQNNAINCVVNSRVESFAAVKLIQTRLPTGKTSQLSKIYTSGKMAESYCDI